MIGQDALRLSPDQKEFKEMLFDAAEISGAVVAGIQVRAVEPPDIALSAFIPQAWAGASVCIRVVSVDGLYEAVNTYRVAEDWGGGVAPITYPTQHGDRLRAAARDGLGIRVSGGACDEKVSDEATVAFWNVQSMEDLTLLLNSFRSDQVFAYVGDAAAPVPCQPLDLPGRTAFDTVCQLSELPAGGRIKLELYRVKNRIPAEPVKVDLWLPLR